MIYDLRFTIARVLLGLGVLGCLGVSATAADRITATITVTNTAIEDDTFIINGSDTRTWKDTVTVPASQVVTGANANETTTNLVNHLTATPPSGVAVYQLGAASFRLDGRTGAPLVITGAGDYFSVAYTTQSVATAYDVVVPYTSFPSARRQTITEGLVDWLNLASGKALFESSAVVSNLVGRTNNQSITGEKQFKQVVVSNLVAIAYVLLPGTEVNGELVFTNINYVGLRAQGLSTTERDELETETQGGIFFNTTLGKLQWVFGADQFKTFASEEDTTIATVLGVSGDAGGNDLTNLGDVEAVNGYNFPGWGTIANQTATGTNSFSDIAFRLYAITSLANGNNSGIVVGTNTFIQVSGPSGAFTINGLTGSPNRNGHLVKILNRTGQNMTIANDSGLEAVAANRIYTLTGADVGPSTGDCIATFIYSTADARWILDSYSP